MKKKFSVLFKNKIKKFNKIISMPGDKSISFRALIISSQLIGVSYLNGVLEGDDIKCCIQSLKNLGVKICFELHGGDMVYNVPTTHRIRDQASKNLGANFDPSHLIWMGGDPVQMVKNLGEAVFYVHIKDVKIDPVQKSLNTLLDTTWFADVNNRSWNFCIPGHGHDEKWWSEFLLALRSIGYEDVLSIEHEDCSLGRNEGMRLTIEFLERILINDIIDYEWSKEKINQLLELWKKGIPEEEASKIFKN